MTCYQIKLKIIGSDCLCFKVFMRYFLEYEFLGRKKM